MHEPETVLWRNRWHARIYRATLNDKTRNNAMPGCAAVKAQLRQVQEVPHVSLGKIAKQINLDIAKRSHQPYAIVVQFGLGHFVKRQITRRRSRSLGVARRHKCQAQGKKNGTNKSGKSGGRPGL